MSKANGTLTAMKSHTSLKLHDVARWMIAISIAYLFVHALAVNLRPLLRIPGGGSFYTVPKMINLGIWSGLVLIAFLFTLQRFDVRDVLRRLRSDALFIVYALVLGLLLIAPFVVTRTPLQFALFGFPFRFDGPWVILLSLLIMGAFARFVTLDARFIRWGVAAFLAVTVFTAIFAILQTRGVDVWAALGVYGLGALPPRTTLGNPAFASLIPAMGAIILANLSTNSRVKGNLLLAIATIGTAAFLAFAAGSASSRSAVVGYWVVLAVWTLASMVRSGSVRQALYPLLVTGILIGSQALGGSTNTYASGKFEALTDLVTGEGQDSSWETRIRFWTIAARALQDQPFIPYGSGAFSIIMWEYATPEETLDLYRMFVPEEYVERTQRQENILFYTDDTGQQRAQRVNSDKIHNYILDIWFAYGFFPALALIAFIIALIARLVRANTTVTWAVISAGVVYGFFSMAWFPAVATDPIVFALLGIGWGAAERKLRDIPDDEAAFDDADGEDVGENDRTFVQRGRQPRSRAEARRLQREAAKKKRRR